MPVLSHFRPLFKNPVSPCEIAVVFSSFVDVHRIRPTIQSLFFFNPQIKMRLLSFALVISVFFRRTFSCVFNAEYDVIYESTKCGSFSLCTVPDRYPSRGCSLFVQIADQHLCLTHSICFFIILSLSLLLFTF